jgi:hypothetical protein
MCLAMLSPATDFILSNHERKGRSEYSSPTASALLEFTLEPFKRPFNWEPGIRSNPLARSQNQSRMAHGMFEENAEIARRP